MRLTEAQGKRILHMAGVPVPRGKLAHSVAEAEQIARDYADGVVIKAQVLAQSRGLNGGIHFAQNSTDVGMLTTNLLGTSIQGEQVASILVEERVVVSAELYLAMRINPGKRCIDILASQLGGNGIE